MYIWSTNIYTESFNNIPFVRTLLVGPVLNLEMVGRGGVLTKADRGKVVSPK